MVKSFIDGILKRDKFLVYYDPDVDGICAGVIAERFIRHRLGDGVTVARYINSKRAHGFLMSDSEKEKYRGYVAICVDFSMTEEEVKALDEFGITVLNLDHHSISFETPKLIGESLVINNQSDKRFADREFLSGAGVVWEVLEPWISDEVLRAHCEFLVGVSLISDARPYAGECTRMYIDAMIREAQRRWSDSRRLVLSVPNELYSVTDTLYDRVFMEFKFNPIWNAFLRFDDGLNGLGYEVIAHFMGDLVIPKVLMQDIVSRQKALVSSALTEFDWLDLGSSVAIGVTRDSKYETFLGLICNKRVRETGGSCFACLLPPTGGTEVVRGSYRGVSALKDVRNFIPTADGHSGAFGFSGFDLSKLDIHGLYLAFERLGGSVGNSVIEFSSFHNFSKKYGDVLWENGYKGSGEATMFKFVGDDTSIVTVSRGRKAEYHSPDGVKVIGFLKDASDPIPSLSSGFIRGLFRKGGYIELVLDTSN